jgi:hypothetical protein
VDVLGVGFSSLCIVHCLALPVAITVLPLWPSSIDLHGAGELFLLALIIPTTLIAMWVGYRRHGSRRPLLILAAGLAIVIAAQAAHGIADEVYPETVLTVTGSSLLVAGHWRNWRSSRKHCSHI